MSERVGYIPLVGSLIHSTIWREPDHVRLLWITMLCLADSEGYVGASVPGLADAARITVEQCRDGLEILMRPDPDSRNPTNGGRRVFHAERGFLIPGVPTYREHIKGSRNKESRQEYQREWDREHRPSGHKRKGPAVRHSPTQSDTTPTKSDPTETETYTPKSTARCENSPAQPVACEKLCKQNFDAARRIYPGKKRGLDVEFANFRKKHKSWRQILDDDGLKLCIESLVRTKAYSEGFWPMFQTFCNQNRWEEAME